MTLQGFREFFATNSGRYDLVSEDYSEGKIDFFIAEALKYLDANVDTEKGYITIEFDVALGAKQLTIPIESVQDVYFSKAGDNGNSRLHRYTIREANAEFEDFSNLNSITSGTPYAYVIESYFRENFTPFRATTRSIRLLPPPNIAGKITVSGKAKTNLPADNGDTNFWLLRAPFMLYQAVMYHLEMAWRNTQGMNDARLALEELMRSFAINEIEEEVNDNMHLNNPWRLIRIDVRS